MVDLQAAIRQRGFPDAVTYIQTGNIVTASEGDEHDVKLQIEAAIRAGLGLQITAIVRQAADFTRIASAHPFDAEGIEAKRLHISFFDVAADSERWPTTVWAQGDGWQVSGRELAMHLPVGFEMPKLAKIDRRLKTPSTTRNWNVVTTLATMLSPSV